MVRPAVMLLLAGVLAGCSFIEFAWQRADEAIVDRVDEWLDLDADQEAALDQRVDRWLARARGTHVPAVARFLERLAARTGDGFSLADARWADHRVRDLYRPVAAEVIEWLAPTLAGLDRDQQLHLARRIRERNAEYWEEYLAGDAEQRKRALADRIMRRVERWTGPLRRDQRAFVYAQAQDLPDNAGAWFRFRARMQVRLLGLIAEDAGVERIEAHLRDWWIELEPRSRADRARSEALRRGIRRLLVDLHGELTPAQRVEAGRELRGAAADLSSLAAGAVELPEQESAD